MHSDFPNASIANICTTEFFPRYLDENYGLFRNFYVKILKENGMIFNAFNMVLTCCWIYHLDCNIYIT